MLGIITAMSAEIKDLKNSMTEQKPVKRNGVWFTYGKIKGKDVVLCEAGIGKVNAAIATVNMCRLEGVTAILNTGVAGGLSERLKPRDLLLPSSCVYHDLDLGGVEGSGFDYAVYECSAPLVKKLGDIMRDMGISYQEGIIATGDQFIKSTEKAKWIRDTFSAAAVDMESAAIAHACMVSGMPFAVVRAVSDNATDEAAHDFDHFLEDACRRSLSVAEEFIRRT